MQLPEFLERFGPFGLTWFQWLFLAAIVVVLAGQDARPVLVATADRGRARAAQWRISAWKNALVAPPAALAAATARAKDDPRLHVALGLRKLMAPEFLGHDAVGALTHFEFAAQGWGGMAFAGCPMPAAYCTVGTTAGGCSPSIGSSGTPSSSSRFLAAQARSIASW